MKINRKGIKGGIPTVTVVTVGRENRGPSGHGYYCFSLSVDLLRVVALAALTLAPNLLDKTPAVRVRISPST